MRKALLTLTALAGLSGAGAAFTAASAQPVPPGYDPAFQTVQYYDHRGPEGGWHHHEWERHRRWVEWHRWHHDTRGW